jgi:hypothetical protein
MIRGRRGRLRLVFAVAAVPMLTNAGTQALANSVPSLVSVTRCRVDTSYVTANPFYGPAQQNDGGNVRLAFENENGVSAISVRFIVTEGAYEQQISVNGRFARGVEIERSFKEDSAANGNQHAKCAVAEVYFADGSSWSAGPADVAPR